MGRFNPLHIIQGWINDAIKHNNWEKASAYRMTICNKCPEMDKKNIKCTKCGCPLMKKTKSNSSCPLGKW